MEQLKTILVWFEGKKTYFNSLVLIIVPYLVANGTINAELGTVICGIVGILTGSGKYIADKAVASNSKLGAAIKNKRK